MCSIHIISDCLLAMFGPEHSRFSFDLICIRKKCWESVRRRVTYMTFPHVKKVVLYEESTRDHTW
jgi:hypothetical protein